MKKVIGFVGLPGAGKSTALKVAAKYGPIIVMGDVVREETTKRGLTLTSENVGTTAKNLRKEFGPDIIAHRCIEKIQQLPNSLVFIDGLRSPAEVSLFKQSLDMMIVAIDAPTEKRYEWIQNRGRADDEKTLDIIKARDRREIEFGVQKVIDSADFVLNNMGSITILEESCENLLSALI